MTKAIRGRRARPIARWPKWPQSTWACSPGRLRKGKNASAFRPRSQACDEMPKVMGAPAVTTLIHHRVEPAGGQHRELLQGLVDEGQIRIDPRRAWPQSDPRQAGLGEHPHQRSAGYCWVA